VHPISASRGRTTAAPAPVRSSSDSEFAIVTSQWMRFLAVFGSDTPGNTIDSNGAPGMLSTYANPCSASSPESAPRTSARPRASREGGAVDDDLVQAVRRYLSSHANTELAAFRIGHDRPWEALPVGKYRRAELLALGHGGRMDVDMDALLDGPFFWDGVDP